MTETDQKQEANGHTIASPLTKDEALRDFADYGKVNGMNFWIARKHLDAKQLIDSVFLACSQSDYVYADTRRKKVYLGLNKSCMVKKYLLHSLRRKLHAEEYGIREFCELSEVIRRGVITAKPLAYFEKKVFGLTVLNGLCIDYIENVRHNNSSDIEKTITLLGLLFHKGVYHSDFSPPNLLTNDELQEIIPIDFMYSLFFHKPNLDSLLLQTARFIKTNGHDVDGEYNALFLNQLYGRIPELHEYPFSVFRKIVSVLVNYKYDILSNYRKQGRLLPADLV